MTFLGGCLVAPEEAATRSSQTIHPRPMLSSSNDHVSLPISSHRLSESSEVIAIPHDVYS